MSPILITLATFSAALAFLAVCRPSLIFQYPFAIGLLMISFIVPQCWTIEQNGEMNDFAPETTWMYMTICMVAICAGFWLAKFGKSSTRASEYSFSARYDLDRLSIACFALVAIGGVAFVLMNREAANNDLGSQWTGVITVYALLTVLLKYGSALAWISYLHTGAKKFLYMTFFGMSFFVPSILASARRQLAFEVATILLLGFFFVRRKTVSRLVLIPMLVAGGILLNQAGEIRSQINGSDRSFFEALRSSSQADETRPVQRIVAAEVSGAVTDVALTNWSTQYTLWTSYYDTLVQLYFPAFIFGRETKDNMKYSVATSSETFGSVFSAGGSTRTGFSDSFAAFHFLGCLVFAAIAFYFGRLWRFAHLGDVRAQVYYIALLGGGIEGDHGVDVPLRRGASVPVRNDVDRLLLRTSAVEGGRTDHRLSGSFGFPA